MAFGVPVKLMAAVWPLQTETGFAAVVAVGNGTGDTVTDSDNAWAQTPPTLTLTRVKTEVVVTFGITKDAVPDAFNVMICVVLPSEYVTAAFGVPVKVTVAGVP